LKAHTPAPASAASSPAFLGTTPPMSSTFTAVFPSAAARFISSAATLVVAGMELSGMSQSVVTPPATAARVALAKPSQSVRPGSFT
jgi:hypothetical protein